MMALAVAINVGKSRISRKIGRQASSPAYRERVLTLGQAQQENYRRARGAIAANQVSALDRVIALAAKAA